MAEALEVLLNRRSVRDFTQEKIAKDVLDRIVDAGLHAATAMNRQSWFLTVVTDSRLLAELSNAVANVLVDSGVPSLVERGRSKDFSTFHHAPAVIFVSSDGSHYSLADCANASQNMCLAAAALGLGSCYIGSFVQAFDHPKGRPLRDRFDLPEGYDPVFAIAIGHPSDEPASVLGPKQPERKVAYID